MTDLTPSIGIHDIAMATSHYVVELDDMAAAYDIDPAKYRRGLGQEQFSFPAPDEDIVTMGAAAAKQILDRHGADGIRTVLFATETGVDQSKAAGLYVHRLLGLPPTVRTAEIKQACYSGTIALQAALGIIARNPDERVLIIASDVARYALDSGGEPTQGAGAVAMLISRDPAVLRFEPATGVASIDVDDFWRPNDSTTAVVDGALSLDAYLDSLTSAWEDYLAHGGASAADIDRFIYHQPFTKMAVKAHRRLAEHTGTDLPESVLETSFSTSRRLGNTYTASTWGALLSVLAQEDGLADKRIGFFSYGSGSVGEVFSGIVSPSYRDVVRPTVLDEVYGARASLPIEAYRRAHADIRSSSDDLETPRVTSGPFRFAGVRGRARQYEPTGR